MTMANPAAARHSSPMLQRTPTVVLPILAFALLWTGTGRAEEPTLGQPAEDERPVWTLALENDLTNDTDRYFTNGIRLSRTSRIGDVPEAVVDAARPLIGTLGSVRWTVGIGQNMYTPSDIRIKDPDPDDQPYAGWLYGTVGVLNDLATGGGRRTQTSVQLSLGVVGPSALGEQAQKFVHSIINSPEPQGWDHQLHDEPAVLLNLERRWVVPSEPLVGDLSAGVVMTFGDVRVSYVQVLRTKEFDGQEGPSLFGAFSVGYRF